MMLPSATSAVNLSLSIVGRIVQPSPLYSVSSTVLLPPLWCERQQLRHGRYHYRAAGHVYADQHYAYLGSVAVGSYGIGIYLDLLADHGLVDLSVAQGISSI